MRFTKPALCLLIGLLVAFGSAHAQNPTGTLSGRVTYEGDAMPGVTVTVSSPALQGDQTVATSGSGDYLFRFLPPGTYEVSFALASFKTLTSSVKISATQSRTLDAIMIPEAVTGEIVVSSSYETISTASGVSTTFEQDVINKLPVNRDVESTTLLAPGTSIQGRHGVPSISGAPFNESMYMVNGVDARETVFGSALDIYIEDAILETTVSTTGISAEYGRFSGGMVNVLTKSGGNQFSGSYRMNLTNDDWSARTPLTTAKEDEINKVHEATLGGYFLKDKLWFFLAGRDLSISETRQMLYGEVYPTGQEQTRYEGKLTWSPGVGHRIVGSYLEVEDDQTNIFEFMIPFEEGFLSPFTTRPMSLWALNYTGVFGSNFFVEAQYSDRNTELVTGSAQQPGDRINGTPILHVVVPTGGHDALLCATCGGDEAEQQSGLLKFSYFASTENLGTHDLVAGYQDFTDRRTANKFDSASNYWVIPLFAPPVFDASGVYTPNFRSFLETGSILDLTLIFWNPVPVESTGNNYDTRSVFVNDTWRLNSRLTFNLGVRYDKTDVEDATGALSDHDRWSPRLGMTWDLKGNGEWLINASVGRYTAYVPQSIGGASGAGSFWQFQYGYFGPDTTGMPAAEALEVLFNWFDAAGGPQAPLFAVPFLAGANNQIGSLETPLSDEISVGFTKRLGNRGLIRADYVRREYGDFFASTRDLTTGTVTVDMGIVGVPGTQDFDLGVVGNDSDVLRREYDGLHTQFQYRFSDRLQIGGNWTWSHTRGNFAGETVAGQGLSFASTSYSPVFEYPEYKDLSWNIADGDLPQDQRHKVRFWLMWDMVSSRHHQLNLSVLQSFATGAPYGSLGRITFPEGAVENPGYLTPPTTTDYWFESSGTYRTDNVSSTNLALNYSFLFSIGGADLEIYVQPEVINLFNEHGTIRENPAILVLPETFNPFTEQPVEGVHWMKADTFGQPLTPNDYQPPRTFRVSLGIRF